MTKLTNYKIKRIVNDRRLERRTNREIAQRMGVSVRRIQQIYSEYRKSGEYPVLKKERRPKKCLTIEEMKVIDEEWEKTHMGATYLQDYIYWHRNVNISHNRIHRYLLATGRAKEDPKKKRKRKRCRYERKHSLSLLHSDWYEPKWNKEVKLIAYLDDASRYIIAARESKKMTGEITIRVLKKAEKEVESWNGIIRGINTDRGPQYFANTYGKKGKGISQFERYIKKKGIKHIPSRIQNPQTNGKIERWFQSYERHRPRFKTLKQYIDWYNNLMHGELKREWAETPLQAFQRKLPAETLLGLHEKLIWR